MTNKKDTNKKRGKYEQKIAVEGSFIDLIDAAILDASNGNFKKRANAAKKSKSKKA